MDIELESKNDFFFDLDKTIWNWDSAIIGAEDLIDTIREVGKDYYFVTDNTLLSRKEYAKKLSSMNIPADEDQVLTSGYVAAERIAEDGYKKVYAIGEKGLIDELDRKDIKVSKDADAVVAGFDRQFNYDKLRKAMKILQDGGKLYICSTERTFRKTSGEQPHQKPFNKALREYADDSQVELVGKPSKSFRKVFKDYFSYFPTASLVIGDRAADIEFGNDLGMKTGAVMSGDLDREILAAADEDQQPDFGLSNLNRLKRNII
ncbi:MAG: HAD-IIA family hydrolase [Candidatus Nanohalobium sp.]